MVESQGSFASLVALCEELQDTSGRNEKKRLIGEFLRGLRPGEVKPAVLFLTGQVLPTGAGEKLGIGFKTLSNVMSEMDYQKVLVDPTGGGMEDIHSMLLNVASQSQGGEFVREAVLETIFSELSPKERRWLAKMIAGELRIGAAEGVVLDAVAYGAEVEESKVREAYQKVGAIEEVAHEALVEGASALDETTIRLFRPVRPMLALQADSLEDALETVGEAAVEVKYDGIRAQVHLSDGEVRLYSRRLSDITESFPDVVDDVSSKTTFDEAILDGEIIGVGREGKPLPFQDLGRRMQRVKDVERMVEEVPVEIRLFDCILHEGDDATDLSYSDRFDLLENSVSEEILSARIVTDSPSRAQEFFEEAVEQGGEGVMAKDSTSRYRLGKRGKAWLKVKRVHTLDLVVLGSDWGHGRRKGWLSDYYLGCLNEEKGEFDLIGKTFKGPTDEQFRELTERLKRLKTSSEGNTVWVEPEIVVEVDFDGVQKSPRYPTGYTLRIARIKRIRRDLDPGDVDTYETVKELYRQGLKRKGEVEGD